MFIPNLISTLCKEGKVIEGKLMLSEIEGSGCCPNSASYNVVINFVCVEIGLWMRL